MTGERIGDRHDDAAAQELPALGREDADRDELPAEFSVVRDDLEKRSVGIADLQGPEQVRVAQAALGEVRLGVFAPAEGPVIVLNHPRKDGRRPCGIWGRALGRWFECRQGRAVAHD